ncbi:hypothetical protein [Oceaniglobus indicus]|uniref:hypothetical protein n=1 Tax=Oceaniglobus indicus TaxID=2047749 RepID=UPI00147418E5|nr:hypothetical protein [Oceaniglobus indicus]
MPIDRTRLLALGAAFMVAAVFVAANIHLVSVAVSSQPACILTPKEGVASHRAAKPSC